MSGVLHPKLGSSHSITVDPDVDDEPTHTAIRPARPAYANDGPDTPSAVVDLDDEVDDEAKPIRWVRHRAPRLQH
jgi:hypothetical protein